MSEDMNVPIVIIEEISCWTVGCGMSVSIAHPSNRTPSVRKMYVNVPFPQIFGIVAEYFEEAGHARLKLSVFPA